MTDPRSVRLQDPSQFRQLSQWDVELTQIEPGTMETRVTVWDGQNLSLIDLSFDKAVHQSGTSRRGVLAFGLPDPQRIVKWLGRPPTNTDVMTFGSDGSFDGVSASVFSGVVFGIDAEHAQTLADDCGIDISETLKGAAMSSISSVGEHHSRLRRMARRRIASGLEALSSGEEDDLILAILEMLSTPKVWTDNSDAPQRVRASKLAVEFITANLDEAVSVSQICAEVGVSAPTLRRGFLEAYGVGPKQFLLRSRLNKVHAQLVDKVSDRAIADVANAYGFWHMGQFARDYRNFFGELPSQTVAETGRC